MMRRSALAIDPFITRMASQSANERPSARLGNTRCDWKSGRGCHVASTKGSNTHKGAIWTLGLLAERPPQRNVA